MNNEEMIKMFNELNAINVNEYIEKKKDLSYLSWTYAIGEISKRYNFDYEIEKFENNLPYVYDENTGYMVFTKVTINGKTKEMWLPVMDSNNKAMKKEEYEYTTKNGKKKVEACTMFDVNKTIMRCLVKNLAMFGLGLYVYNGEDLPQVEKEELEKEKYITEEQAKELAELLGERLQGMLEYFKINNLSQLTKVQYEQLIPKIKQ